MFVQQILKLLTAAAAYFATHNITQILNETETQIHVVRQLDQAFENATGFDIPWIDESIEAAQGIVDAAEWAQCGSIECESS